MKLAEISIYFQVFQRILYYTRSFGGPFRLLSCCAYALFSPNSKTKSERILEINYENQF